MVTPRVFATLPEEEKKLWHSHVFEVQSGMLILPNPSKVPVPDAAWEKSELAEMRDVQHLYGKTYHFWQTDRGDAVPMGAPVLMSSFTSEEQLEPFGGMDALCGKRDENFGANWSAKRSARAGLKKEEPQLDISKCESNHMLLLPLVGDVLTVVAWCRLGYDVEEEVNDLSNRSRLANWIRFLWE